MAIVAYGETASLVLPPTTVTEEKREGLHGRVPRRVLEQTLRSLCLECICIFVGICVFVFESKFSGHLASSVVCALRARHCERTAGALCS